MKLGISNFYLMTPLKWREYVQMNLSNFLTNVHEHYKPDAMATSDGKVYVAVKRAMYGLMQAGILAQELLKERLNKHLYRQRPSPPGLDPLVAPYQLLICR